MTDKKGRRPDYKGKIEVAGWLEKDKNGNMYISCKTADNFRMFANIPREKTAPRTLEK